MNVVKELTFGDQGRMLVAPDTAALNENTAELFVQTGTEAIAKRGQYTIALSGGSTPKSLYDLLATEPWRSRIEWSKVQVFWGDERFVPHSDKQSNYRMAMEALLSKLPISKDNIHPIETEGVTPEESAKRYEATLRKVCGPDPKIDFDLLGVGTNGHTASLFPHQPALHIKDRLVFAEYIDEVKMDRVSFSVPFINASRLNVFLVAGKDKAPVLKEVLRGKYQPEQLPSQLIRGNPQSLLWLVDAAAAADLS